MKVYDDSQLKLIDKLLKSILEGLEIEIATPEITSRGWVRLTVSGEDEKIALKYLASEIGLCPVSLESVKRFSTAKGRVTALNKNGSRLLVDIGVFSPKIVDATISLHHLQAQLADGRKIALRKIVELFGFCENLPLTVKILSIEEENSRVETMLAEEQLARYRNWARSLLDRLIVLGVPIAEIESALKEAQCSRDIVDIEPLGLFEHAVVCKLGTDAAGLIPQIGRKLPQAAFTVFNPKRILEFFDYDLTVPIFQ